MSLLLQSGGFLLTTVSGHLLLANETDDVANFKAAFPEFVTVADTSVEFWLNLAYKLHAKDRLGYVWWEAVCLFVAHNLALEMAAQRGAGNGGAPGLTASAAGVTSKSVGSVSVSYGTGSGAMDANAGHWNMTVYGLRYWRLVRLVATVCYQLPSYGGYSCGW